MKKYIVAVFPIEEKGGQFTAYLRYYNPAWPGCCLHNTSAENGSAAKRQAIADHKSRCDKAIVQEIKREKDAEIAKLNDAQDCRLESENAELKAEIERLTTSLQYWQERREITFERWNQTIEQLRIANEEIERLKAENERIVAESKQCHSTNDELVKERMDLRDQLRTANGMRRKAEWLLSIDDPDDDDPRHAWLDSDWIEAVKEKT